MVNDNEVFFYKGKKEKSVNNNFQVRIGNAFMSNDIEKCFNVLADLDEILTGNRCSNGQEKYWRQQISQFLNEYAQKDFPSEVFYLSDGGFSRLSVYVSDDGHTKIISEPTYNSLDSVKEKWELIK